MEQNNNSEGYMLRAIVSWAKDNVDPRLYKRIFTDEFTHIFTYLERHENANAIRPRPENVLSAFGPVSFNSLKVIILGQDPYPSDHASGMAFSSDLPSLPPSLKNIFGCLIEQGLIDSMPKSANLRGWAQQGVLLLNTALTVNIDKGRNSHSVLWRNYTRELIARLCQDKHKPMCFMLWGQKAIDYSDVIKRNSKYAEHKIFTWRHPSPMANSMPRQSPEHFINCQNFKETNLFLAQTGRKPIDWSNTTGIMPLYIATDGACSGNGTPKGKCSAACLVYEHDMVANLWHRVSNLLAGSVSNEEAPPSANSRNKAATKLSKDKFKAKHARAVNVAGVGTNNIGELWGLIFAFDYVIENHRQICRDYSELYIITDSQYCIKALIYDDVTAKKQNVKANRQLVHTLIDKYEEMKALLTRARFKFTIDHQRGHDKLSQIGLRDIGELRILGQVPHEYIKWLGILNADLAATSALADLRNNA